MAALVGEVSFAGGAAGGDIGSRTFEVRLTGLGCGIVIEGVEVDLGTGARAGAESPLVSSRGGGEPGRSAGRWAKTGWILEERKVGEIGRRGGVADIGRGEG